MKILNGIENIFEGSWTVVYMSGNAFYFINLESGSAQIIMVSQKSSIFCHRATIMAWVVDSDRIL